MKKSLFILCLTFLSLASLWAQCVFSCYTYTQSAITYSMFPTGGTNVINQFSPSIDDGITAPVPIGFNFTYYCATYSTVLICSNGFLQFDIGSPPNLAFSNPAQSFPDPASPNGIVALNMNDFDPNMGGTITYMTIGTSPNQRFILTYSNVPMWSCSTIVNSGQIILYEGSDIIEIHTERVTDPNNSSAIPCYNGTQGIENPNGSAGLTVAGRSNSMWTATTPSAHRFSPIGIYAPAAPTTTISGISNLCEGTPAIYTINPSPGALSYNWNLPFGWTGTSSLTTISTTAGTSGTISVSSNYTCGASAVSIFTVDVNPRPVVSITSATPVIFCSGRTVTISTAGAATYTLEPGNQISGPPFLDMPMASTVYSVTGTSTAGCISKNVGTFSVIVQQTPTVSVNSGTVCLGQSFTVTPAGAYNYVLSIPFNETTPPFVGTHTVSVVGSATNGCVGATVYSSITALALPSITAGAVRPVICVRETSTLTAGGGVSYIWQNNSTFSTSALVVKPLSTTEYTVEGTDINGCQNSMTVSVKVNPCTGIDELVSTGGKMNIYPNPSAGIFNIETEEPALITIHDLLGRQVYSLQMTTREAKIDLNESPSGTYIITATFKKGKSQAMHVKE